MHNVSEGGSMEAADRKNSHGTSTSHRSIPYSSRLLCYHVLMPSARP